MNRLGIRTRVVLLALVPLFLIASALSWYFIYIRIDDLDRALAQQAVAQARHLARASEYGLFVGERSYLDGLARDLEREDDVLAVGIADGSGNSIVSIGPVPRPSPRPAAGVVLDQGQAGMLVVSAPVVLSVLSFDDPSLAQPAHRPLGYVTLAISKAETRKRQREMLVDGMFITVIGMVLAGLLALSLARDVVRPILRLSGAVKRIGAGDLNVRVETGTGGEFAHLERGINRMTEELRASYDGLQDKIRDATARLSWQASHDALTGLANRSEFERRLELALGLARSRGERHSLLYLDLDQFKIVNDTSGHQAGDELLRRLSALMKREVRETDVLARLGGDEFGVLLHVCDEPTAVALAERLRRVVEEFRFQWEGRTYGVGVSLGVVEIHAGWGSLAKLMSAADAACYAAKDAGRNRIHVYREGDAELERRKGEMEWATRLGRAIAERRFHLCAQRIEPLAAGGETHYELLLRLDGEQGEVIPPMAFIPAAERYQLMPTLDRLAVEQAMALCAELPSGPGPVWLNVNLSGASLGDPAFQEFLRSGMRDCPERACRFCFEITETAAMANLENVTRLIEDLRRLGCRFALDDFGSGLSSFAYLRALPVDYLKIEGAFVRDMVEDPVDYAMVEAIQKVARLMGIRTIAESVESEAVRERLRELGVDYAQGNLLHVPQPARIVFGKAWRER